MSAAAHHERARDLVEARLGRLPQDMLEAAVVLEAWGGVRADHALETGRELMGAASPEQAASRGALPPPPPRDGAAAEAVSFIIAVLAIACWSSPLTTDLGASAAHTALLVALPLTLGLQWGLRSRYLARPEGLALLSRRRGALLLFAGVMVGGLGGVLGVGGLLAALLTIIWTAGTVLIRRRWAALYSVLVIAATACLLSGFGALDVLAIAAAVSALTVALALRGHELAPGDRPGRRRRAVCAALIGAGFGVLLVADPTLGWTTGSVPALALLPSTVASYWGGYHLWRFQLEIPRALAGIAVAHPVRLRRSAVGLRVLVGAAARLLGLTAALSALSVLVAEQLGSRASEPSLLVAFGLVALATLLVSLLESVGRASAAFAAVALAVAGELSLNAAGAEWFPGAGMIVGSGLALAVAVPVAVALFRSPARTLATALWIA